MSNVKKISGLGLVLIAASLSACAGGRGLGPNYAASDAYVQEVFDTRNQPPTAENCAEAELNDAWKADMSASNRAYHDRLIGRCRGTQNPGARPRN
jgi:hypothetical protein